MKKICFLSLSLLLLNFNLFSQELNKKDNKSFKVLEHVPVFPGCLGDRGALTRCFSKRLYNHFVRELDSKLIKKLNLAPGKKKIFISFEINEYGKVDDIDIKAGNDTLEKEVYKVLKKLPKIKPGVHEDKPVSIKYSFPFTLVIEETKAQKKARLKKQRKERREKNRN